MPRAIYVPLFDSFFEGSIMREELPVRFVMLALIRLAWRSGANGEVDVDPLIFAQSINLPLPDVEAAIQRLMEPDPTSATPDEDGRRIVPLNPDRPFRGWRLVNWQRYKAMLNRVNDAARKREEYHEAKDTSEVSENLQKSPKVSKRLRLSRISRYETIRDDTRRDETKSPPTVPHGGTEVDGFSEWWGTYPKKIGKGNALEAWKKLTPEDRRLALEAVKVFASSWAGAPEENRQFLVGPAPWLNQKRWTDDPTEWTRMAFRDNPEMLKRRKKQAEDEAHRAMMERIRGTQEDPE